MSLLWCFFVLLTGVVAAHYGERRGRNRVLWFLIGAVFGVAGLVFLYMLPVRRRYAEEAAAPVRETTTSPESTAVAVPTPPDTRYDAIWYYLDDASQPKGPVSMATLQLAWHRQNLTNDSWLWCEGMNDWQQIKEIPAVAERIVKDK